MGIGYALLGRKDLEAASEPKSIFSGKRERGNALIISGSRSYHGAPSLALLATCNILASLRVGAGYATLYVPKAILNPVRAVSPNTIVKALGNNEITCNKEVLDAVERSNAVAIGMGIGKTRNAIAASEKIVQRAADLNKPIVVDADAIQCLRKLSKRHAANSSIIATPHDREFFGLTGKTLPKKDLGLRMAYAVQSAKELGIVIVLKGHNTIVTDGKRIKVNIAKTSALATMGSGDVLSGIICGYAACGADPLIAASAGVYLHSMIGDSLAKRKGNHIIAVDIVDGIPSAIKDFDKSIR
ncbi:MAG: NAD(P)H-hydrate dehydratase [Candidatus Micrarchaeaceae archaeon]